MLIAREIYFRDLRSGVDERPDIFHNVKTNIGNSVCAQPAKDSSPLQRDRHFPQRRDREMRARNDWGWDERIEHGFFFAPDLRCPPDRLAHIAAELFFDVGKNAMTNLVSR